LLQKRLFVHRKFARKGVFPMFVLNGPCKNRLEASVVQRNKLEWLFITRQFVSRFHERTSQYPRPD
jgi:hypothetical protein